MGGFSCILLTNSCEKDFLPTGNGTAKNRVTQEELKSFFLKAIQAGEIKKTFYLVDKIEKKMPIDHDFLSDRYLSDQCDIVHIYGYIKRIPDDHLIQNKDIYQWAEVYHEGNRYQICVYFEERTIKLPCNQEPVRKINVKNLAIRETNSNNLSVKFSKNV